jgi:hypothetical protein
MADVFAWIIAGVAASTAASIEDFLSLTVSRQTFVIFVVFCSDSLLVPN